MSDITFYINSNSTRQFEFYKIKRKERDKPVEYQKNIKLNDFVVEA